MAPNLAKAIVTYFFTFNALLPWPLALAEEPALPEGLLFESDSVVEMGEPPPATETIRSFLDDLTFHGFVDIRTSARVNADSRQKDFSLAEVRSRINTDAQISDLKATLTADFVYDPIVDPDDLNLSTGRGFIDLREAYLVARPLSFMDIKLGRQVLTWGTGEFLFINDLFPKDFGSFFIWRDTDFLKAPSDALRTGIYTPFVNIDFVYTPQFDANRFIDGRRITFFNSFSGELNGREQPLEFIKPSDWFTDDEFALRLYKVFGGLELALYGYRGFWKNPVGNAPDIRRAIFPRLAVYGASARGPLLGGIASIEAGYYDSLDNRDAQDSNEAPSELRLLAAYEKEVLPELLVATQYYVERIQRFGTYQKSIENLTFHDRERYRHVATLRFEKCFYQKTFRLTIFLQAGLSESDGLVRSSLNYEASDSLKLSLHSNIFLGSRESTSFGQFENASSVGTALRYAF